MDDPRQIAGELSEGERRALLSLTDESESATIMTEVAARLQDRGLAVIHPDGLVDLSDLGRDVIEHLRRKPEPTA